MSRVVYPGSFDPLTNGHLDIVKRAAKIFDEVVVAVADNPAKKALMTKDERIDIIRDVLRSMPRIEVDAFDGLLVDYVRRKKAGVILRGIRTISDFDFEYKMALTNRSFAKDIDTVFMMTNEEYSFTSSTFIKEAAALGGDVGKLVPKEVEKFLRKKFKQKDVSS